MCALKKRPRIPDGFLLLELVLSVAVLAITLTVISRSFFSSLSALRSSAHFFQAGLLAEEKLLELETRPHAAGSEGGFETGGDPFRWRAEREKMDTLPLEEVRVTVGWPAVRGEQRLHVTTYLPRDHDR